MTMTAKDKEEEGKEGKEVDKGGALDDFFSQPKTGKKEADENENENEDAGKSKSKSKDTSKDKSEDDRLGDISPDVEVVTMPPRKTDEKTQKAEGDEIAEKVVIAKGVTAEEAAIIEAEIEVQEGEFTDELDDELLDLPDEVAEVEVEDDNATEREEEVVEDEKTAKKVKEPELTRERKEDILLGLGFTRYDNEDGKIKFSLLEDDIKVGVTFDAKNPDGNVWAKHQDDKETGKKGEFLEHQERVELPLLKMYYSILKGDEPIPKPTVIGKVVERRGGGVGIEFEEEVGGLRTEYYPLKAVNKDTDGSFIPKGFSKAWKDRDAKMHLPRDIRLPQYEEEFAKVEVNEPSSQDKGQGQEQKQDQKQKQEPDKATETPDKALNVDEKKQQLSDDWSWAMDSVMAQYCTKVKENEKVDMHEGLSTFLQKSAVTLFIALQNYRK